MEPLLTENNKRFVLFPIEHNDIWKAFKQQESFFWTAEEIDLSSDLTDWHSKLNDNEKHFIKYVLAFFSSSDGLVGENLAANFYKEVQWPEARAYYANQLFAETVHSETYSLLIDTYIKSNEEKKILFEAVENIPVIKKKNDWAMKWMDKEKNSFAQRLVAFAIVEGIFFSGSFCAIFWLKKRGLMKGLAFSNELISRDEASHCDFAALLYSKLNNKLSRDEILAMIFEAVDVEVEFIAESLPVELIGMNSKLMSEYIRFVADRALVSLGYEKHYNANNPFDFMKFIATDVKANFFERLPAQYTKASVGKTVEENSFSLDADF